MVKLFKQTEVELTLVEGHTILASEFDKYADDTKVKLSFENTTDPYVSRNGWELVDLPILIIGVQPMN